jgi:hypothetical protein
MRSKSGQRVKMAIGWEIGKQNPGAGPDRQKISGCIAAHKIGFAGLEQRQFRSACWQEAVKEERTAPFEDVPEKEGHELRIKKPGSL